MIVGMGTDIVSIERITEAHQQFGERFCEKILASIEREQMANRQQKMAFLAKRFAVKEAFAKALGSGMRYGLGWHDVWVEYNQDGKPELVLSAKASALCAKQNINAFHVSISDERRYAVATVILESIHG